MRNQNQNPGLEFQRENIVRAFARCATVSAAVLLLGGIGAAQPVMESTNNPSGLQLVALRDGVDPDGFIGEFGLSPKYNWRSIRAFAAHLDAATIAKLKADKGVEAIGPDSVGHICDQTVGTGVQRMGIPSFPEAHIDGLDHQINVNVAVLDSGIQLNHPDLNVVYAQDFTGSGSGGNDANGHGTHVAGIIGALDNTYGVVGVAPGARLWALQIATASGAIEESDAINALNYALNDAPQIEVVNCSWTVIGASGAGYTVLHNAIKALVAKGVVVVAGAANNSQDIAGPDGTFGTSDDVLPAAFPEVMAVSAMDPTSDTNAAFSNYNLVVRTNVPGPGYYGGTNYIWIGITNYVTSPGGAIDVAAPGVNIYSTWINSSYTNDTGTSMSCPHVVGLVALYIAANGRPTNAAGVYALRQAIIDNSLPQSQWNATNTYAQGFPAPLAMPSENWIPQPAITSQEGAPGNFDIGFAAVPGYDYTLQSTTDLTSAGEWTNLSTVSGSGAVAPALATDTNLNSQSFYRLWRHPSP